jgi:omega-amidase
MKRLSEIDFLLQKIRKMRVGRPTFDIGIIQRNWIEEKTSFNIKANIEKYTKIAKERNAKMILLQEYSLYPHFDPKIYAEDLNHGESSLFFRNLAKTNEIHVIGSILEKCDDKVYSTAAMWDNNGNLVGSNRRQHITEEEKGIISPGDSNHPVFILNKKTKIAFPSSYDIFFPESARMYAQKGAVLLCYPGSWDAHSQKKAHIMGHSHAIGNAVFVVCANNVDPEENYQGGSFGVRPDGVLLAIDNNCEPLTIVQMNVYERKFWKLLFPLIKQRSYETFGLLKEKIKPNFN